MVAAAVVVLVAGIISYAVYRNQQISRVTVRGITAVPPSGVENILLVGNNSRCVLSGRQAIAFGTCSEVGGARSDVTMLLHLDPSRHTAAVLSIPRDLFLPIPGSTSANRVDDALNVGPERLVETVQQDLGIPVNHFVELNFDSFQGVVDALGGVSLYFPDPVKDSYSGLDVTTPGCHYLNGTQALAVVRARHLYYENGGRWVYDGQGDLARIQRDHEFLRVLAAAVAKRGLGNPLTDNSLLGAVAPKLHVDSGLGIQDMLGLVLAFHSVNATSVPTATLPVQVDANDYLYKGSDYGSVVFPSQPQDQQVVDRFLGVSAPPGANTSPSAVNVSVVNGTGAGSQAADTASALGRLGFHVVPAGDTPSVGPLSETTVYYARGHLHDAQRVLRSLSGTVVMGQGPTQAGAAVTVVTGSELSVQGATATATGSSGSAGSPGTSPATSSSGSSGSSGSSRSQSSQVPSTLSSPTAATQPLPPYDPRSCTPAGAPGP